MITDRLSDVTLQPFNFLTLQRSPPFALREGSAIPILAIFCDPIVQWPRTPPFHGGNTGSNPVRVALSTCIRAL